MSLELWTEVDRYLCEHFAPADEHLDAALAESSAAGLPAIHVSPNLGRLLQLLVELVGARRVLEIGTLGGYSTIWMARALGNGGSIITLEADARHADVARRNIDRAGLGKRVEIRCGLAIDSLERLIAERGEPFDFAFIDADKQHTAEYFDAVLELMRRGGVIVVDNVVRKGEVVDAASTDPSVQGMRRFISRAAADARVTITALQTVGGKGYDGVAIARVR